MTPPVAFYCVCSDLYFLGAVGLINSLRMVGHEEPIYLLDCGLTPAQRLLLGSEATIIDAPDDTPPYLLKTVAPLRHPADVMVLVDVDMIVTRPLGELIRLAASGKVVAFENNIDRHVAEWGEILDLGPLERRRYLCSAFVAMPNDPGTELLRLMEDRQRRAEFGRHCFNINMFTESLGDEPLLYLDQDVLNAVLAARVPADEVVGLPARLTALTPFEGLHSGRDGELRCAYSDGSEPYLLHHILPGKPWLDPMPEGLYSRLLRRLLLSPAVRIRVPEEAVPMRLREGLRAELVRRLELLWLRMRLVSGLWLARVRSLLRGLAQRWAPSR